MSLNKVLLIGRLTRDPEVKILENTTVTKFGIATNKKYKKDGEQKEKTEFHNIVTWGKLAEICGEYLKSGKLIYLEGEITTRSWEADGQKKYMTEIVANDVQFLDSKKSDDLSVNLPPVVKSEELSFKPAPKASGKTVKNYASDIKAKDYADDLGF